MFISIQLHAIKDRSTDVFADEYRFDKVFTDEFFIVVNFLTKNQVLFLKSNC